MIELQAYEALVEAGGLLPSSFDEAEVEELVGDAHHTLGDDEAHVGGSSALGTTEGPAVSGSGLGSSIRDRPGEALAAWDLDNVTAETPYAGAMLTYGAMAASDLGEVERARGYAERVLGMADEKTLHAEALIARGMASFRRGNHTAAVRDFERALQLAESQALRFRSTTHGSGWHSRSTSKDVTRRRWSWRGRSTGGEARAVRSVGTRAGREGIARARATGRGVRRVGAFERSVCQAGIQVRGNPPWFAGRPASREGVPRPRPGRVRAHAS